MAAGDLTLNIGHITGLGGMNPQEDSVKPTQRPGTVSMLVDALGFRIFKYVRAISAVTKGQLTQQTGTGVTGRQVVDNQTGTSTTTVTTSGLTANNERGKIIYVYDATAGALPEGEFSIVASNSATIIKLEPEMPFSTALAANNDLSLIATYQAEEGSVGVLAIDCQGFCVHNTGITAGSHGWVQNYGVTQYVHVGTPSVAIGDNLVAEATGSLITEITTAGRYQNQKLIVANALSVVTDDQATPRGMARVVIFNAVTASSTNAAG